MKNRTRKIIDISLHFSIFALVIFSYLMMALNGWGVKSDTLASSGITSLRFFTVLSNLLMGAISLLAAIFGLKHLKEDEYQEPKWLRVLKLSGVNGVAITFLVVLIFLEPQMPGLGLGFFDLYLRSNFFMHFFVPVLATVAYLFFDERDDFKWRMTPFAIVPLTIYGVFYLINFLVHGAVPKGPEDWYGFGMWGAGPSFFVLLIVLAFGLGVATGLYYLKRIIRK
ncbi:MAG: hypothetical protein J6328_07640 [Bacilli bacterium]|nr:hypothetical protein [Bacilli bacterium]